MILSPSYQISLALIILGMLFWGSWASLFKACGKHRFELFYFDFAIGTGLAALVCAFTFGSLGFDGFSFMDDILNASKKKDLLAILAGGVFNLGNMLLLGAVAEMGLSVAFPIGMGVAIIVGSTWRYFLQPGETLSLWIAGVAVVAAGVAISSSAYRIFELGRVDELVRKGELKSTKRVAKSKGIVLAIIAGLILGSYLPIVSQSMESEIGIGPYTMGVMFAIGVVLSTFAYNLFFMNLPIAGKPLEILDYFRAKPINHMRGWLSGVVWILAFIGTLVAGMATGPINAGPVLSYGLIQGSVLIATIWGLMFFKEFTGADTKVRSMLFIMTALFVCGIGLIAAAPVANIR